MTPTSNTARAAIPPWKWWVVVMMLLATVVNYMDRQALGSMASFIKADFNLNEQGYGTLEAWFGYSYAVFLIVAGFMADRWNLRWLYPIALLVWSAAGLRPASWRLCSSCKSAARSSRRRGIQLAGRRGSGPPDHATRSAALANGVFNSGMTLGAVLTPILVIAMVGPHGEGWRRLFAIVGAAGTIWVVMWLLGTRGARGAEMSLRTQELAEPAAVPFRSLFLLRTFGSPWQSEQRSI